MPAIKSQIKSTISSVINRAEIHGNHIAEYETRTKYAFIDPVLRALEWDLADPKHVKLEFEIEEGRVDYALFKSGCENPLYWWKPSV